MKTLSVMTVMAFASTLVACDDPPATQGDSPGVDWKDAPEQAATGPIFEDEDFTLEVAAPRLCEDPTPLGPKDGLRRVSVPISVTAKTKRAVPISPLPFTLEDKTGHTYRPTLAGCAPTIAQGTLHAGKSLQGEIAFDVPADPGRLELVFEPFLIGRKKVTARVNVP